ncbi:hypothetical protein LOK49_LG11G01364 [Camellia lanceoleosa]|uniref:Uncharacterized protein n=1 Tax=Camellia lanceoleosa TaxID=1840588 RepID=A0ACC0G5R1_9ERIC|nr:hypothetical protein LOK49_LG11G01364 [Camellia lanceoleosa]
MTKQDRLDLRGLLHPNIMSLEQQIECFMEDLKRFELNARNGPSDPNALAMWQILNRLHDRNETMYYKNYSGLFRRTRGMYFSVADRGEMMSMVRILGLSDLRLHGIGIAIGKLDVYVAARDNIVAVFVSPTRSNGHVGQGRGDGYTRFNRITSSRFMLPKRAIRIQVFQCRRDLADFRMGINPGPPIISRKEFETRKADLWRKRAMESVAAKIVVGRNGTEMLTNESGEVTSHLQGMFARTIRLLEAGLMPVYVFDGKPPHLEKQKLAKRHSKRADATEDLNKALVVK